VVLRVSVCVRALGVDPIHATKRRREGFNCLPQTRSWRKRVHDWRWLCTARSSNRIQLRRGGIGEGDQSEIRIGETKRDSDLIRSECLRCVCVCASSENFQRKQNNSTPPHLFFLPLLQRFYNFNVSISNLWEGKIWKWIKITNSRQLKMIIN